MTAPELTTASDVRVTVLAAANLHAAADLLTEHADLPMPYITTSGGTVCLNWFLQHGGDDEASTAARIVRTLDGEWKRREGPTGLMEWEQRRKGLSLLVQVTREAVCERIVVGTETVTVPAVEAKPAEIKTVEKVEWRCQPLLAALDHATETTGAPVEAVVSL